jgi:hypothetical protein
MDDPSAHGLLSFREARWIPARRGRIESILEGVGGMLDDVIEALADLVDGAEATPSKAAEHQPRLGQESLEVEQLEDRCLTAADSIVAAEPMTAAQETAPAEAAAAFATGPEISTSPAMKPAPGVEAHTESQGGSLEAAGEIEHEFGLRVHDSEGQREPSDGRIANRADAEPVEVLSDRFAEPPHQEPLEGDDGEKPDVGGEKNELDAGELATVEERDRDAASAPEGATGDQVFRDAAAISTDIAVGQLAASDPAGIDLAAGQQKLGEELAQAVALYGDDGSPDRPASAPITAGGKEEATTEAVRLADAPQHRAEEGPLGGGADKAAGALHSSSRGGDRVLADGDLAEQGAPEDARAHDACFSAVRQTNSIEEAVAEAVVPDAANK